MNSSASNPEGLAQEIVNDMNERAQAQGTTMEALLKRALSTQVGFGENSDTQITNQDIDPTSE